MKLAAGRRVTLDPATDYARTWFHRYGADTTRFEDIPDEPRFSAARRVTVADGEGRFRFRDLPAGSYLVRTLVTWQDRRDSVQQGGVVAALAEVGPDRRDELIMARRVTRDSAAALVVEILEDAELAGRRWRSRGRLTSWSCEVGSEEPARWNLRYRAAEQEADAVVDVSCRRRGVTFNCWRSIECEGEGVKWES